MIRSLEWAIERTTGAVLVRPGGEINSANVPLLWSNLRAMREDNLHVILDMKAVLSIDSAGVDALLDAYRLFVQCGQRLVLAEPSPMVRTSLLEIARLEDEIPVFATVAEALVSFRSSSVPAA
jgi:anti-anti-sigma factor